MGWNMNMSEIKIDFEKLVSQNSKRLFAGRANGQQAYVYFNINNFSKGDVLELNVPQEVIVSSSYYLGMLEKILPLFNNTTEFYKSTKYKGVEYKEGMLEEFDRAVKRGLHKNEALF
ncbi:Uncharacterised protein [Serratia proteamaculans]|nr:Uncharacterised protein [Serratia proteamaculans]